MSTSLSGQDPELTVDLDEMFGTIVPDSSSFRQDVGQAIIDKIRERASKAEFLNPASKKNQSYSDAYAESEEFKAYGKSKGDVNMELTGDMLGLMDVTSEGKNKIFIGWEDELQAKKAHGHITGNIGVKRDFFGLTIEDIEEIRSRFEDDLPYGDKEKTESSKSGSDFVKSGSTKSFADFLAEIEGENE